MATNQIAPMHLSSFLPKEWLDDVSFEYFIFDFYSTSYHSVARKNFDVISSFCQSMTSYPVKLIIIDLLNEFEISFSELNVVYSEGKNILHSNGLSKKSIPIGKYLIIISPVRKNNGGYNEGIAKDSSLATLGALFSLYGKSIAHSHFGSVRVHRERLDEIGWASTSVEIGKSVGFYEYYRFDLLKAIIDKIECIKEQDIYNKISLCMKLLARAYFNENKSLQLIDYWTALEIINGGPSSLRAKINVENNTDWGTTIRIIRKKRNDIIHEGASKTITDSEKLAINRDIINTICKILDIPEIEARGT
ncbi:hypothetical protein MKI84_03805 [Ancylobacter sp. A5.8]|uniref:hypothetical protein n=1 Tax=Ancylobacter gelatini TaxID=2919920 RepID=UPI001F4D9EDF|nr:hypothetical protein [Ancylobacter gelatini]MCJ8142032.1 hypothetical protein [Ancylobacter gelatini]